MFRQLRIATPKPIWPHNLCVALHTRCCSLNAQGSVMIQMFPWGWEQQQPAGWIDRECMFSHQAEAVSAWYFNWVNRDRLKGLQPMCASLEHHQAMLQTSGLQHQGGDHGLRLMSSSSLM